LVERSGLRLELEGQAPLGTSMHAVATTNFTIDDTYHLVTGKAGVVRNHFNALQLDLEDANGRKLSIEARAYNDAVAFRYVVPEQPALTHFRLTNEKTEFRLSKDAMTYALVLPGFRSMYESEFVKLPASAFANQGGIAS